MAAHAAKSHQTRMGMDSFQLIPRAMRTTTRDVTTASKKPMNGFFLRIKLIVDNPSKTRMTIRLIMGAYFLPVQFQGRRRRLHSN